MFKTNDRLSQCRAAALCRHRQVNAAPGLNLTPEYEKLPFRSLVVCLVSFACLEPSLFALGVLANCFCLLLLKGVLATA